MEGVHSVRSRLKDTEHLLEKIIRKRIARVTKYVTLSASNYHQVVTDLIGVRALHLFKDDCFVIDKNIRSTWNLAEKPIAYVRKGDSGELLREHGFKVKEHPSGYRSIHYVAASQPGKSKVLVEIQVRTIFEEGWSEIDHKIRYPNFSDDELVTYFLTIFNRMAGAADEMGSFVKSLADMAAVHEDAINSIVKERDEALANVERALAEARSGHEQSREMQGKLAQLEKELIRLRAVSASKVEGTSQPDISASRTLAAAVLDKIYAAGNDSYHERLKRSLGIQTEQMERVAGIKRSQDEARLAAMKIARASFANAAKKK